MSTDLIPWGALGATILTLLGVLFGLVARLTRMEDRLDLLYDIYVKEKLRRIEEQEMAVRHSPYRLTEKGLSLLRPDIIEGVCRGPRKGVLQSAQYIMGHPRLSKMIDEQANENGVDWGSLVSAYALYATSPGAPCPNATWWQRLCRMIWPSMI